MYLINDKCLISALIAFEAVNSLRKPKLKINSPTMQKCHHLTLTRTELLLKGSHAFLPKCQFLCLYFIYRSTYQMGICKQDDKTRRYWGCSLLSTFGWLKMIGTVTVWSPSMVSGYVVSRYSLLLSAKDKLLPTLRMLFSVLYSGLYIHLPWMVWTTAAWPRSGY